MNALFEKRLGTNVRVELRIQIIGSPTLLELAALAALLETFRAGASLRCVLCGCERFCDCGRPCTLCVLLAEHLSSASHG